MEKGYLLLECFGLENGSPIDEYRMVLRNFSPPGVIMGENSTGVVAFVGRSALLKVKIAECTERTPRILLTSDENLECVENHL
jgi:hypothetical protein